MAKVLNSWYQARIRSNESWLDQLRQEQSYKLEELKRKLNWYNTEKLIHRYESRLQPGSGPSTPERVDPRSPAGASPGRPVGPQATPARQPPQETEMRTPAPRVDPAVAAAAAQQAEIQRRQQLEFQQQQQQLRQQQLQQQKLQQQQQEAAAAGPLAPRSMPVPAHMLVPAAAERAAPQPQSTSWADRLVDLLVGESPQNSFALICEKCRTNNGLAPKVRYIARCVSYCSRVSQPPYCRMKWRQLNSFALLATT